MIALEMIEELTKLVKTVGYDPEVRVLVPYYCTDWGRVRYTYYHTKEVDMEPTSDGFGEGAEIRLQER